MEKALACSEKALEKALACSCSRALEEASKAYISALEEENAQLRKDLHMVMPYLPPLRWHTESAVDPETGARSVIRRWVELEWTPPEEEEPWDEETAARAQAEMLAAHRATPGL